MLKFQQKYEREREKVGERKFGISTMALPKFLLPKKLTKTNCGNDIVEIGGKKILWQLWQCHCRKWEGKKKSGCRNLGGIKKKKKVLRTQYFYNIFTTNHM